MDRLALLVILLTIVGCTAFAPSAARMRHVPLKMANDEVPGQVSSGPQSPTFRAYADYMSKTRPIVAALSAVMMVPALSFAADAVKAPAVPEEKVVLGPPPTDFGLKYKDFYEDTNKVVNHMRYAVQMEKGDSNIAAVAQATKDEMLDFVSYYRRFNGINGKQSFSLLYTSINVLAGHYTSYGIKFPVPEKRRKRLLQEFLDIEKNVRKKR